VICPCFPRDRCPRWTKTMLNEPKKCSRNQNSRATKIPVQPKFPRNQNSRATKGVFWRIGGPATIRVRCSFLRCLRSSSVRSIRGCNGVRQSWRRDTRKQTYDSTCVKTAMNQKCICQCRPPSRKEDSVTTLSKQYFDPSTPFAISPCRRCGPSHPQGRIY